MAGKKSPRVISKKIQHDPEGLSDEKLANAKPVDMPSVTREQHDARSKSDDGGANKKRKKKKAE